MPWPLSLKAIGQVPSLWHVEAFSRCRRYSWVLLFEIVKTESTNIGLHTAALDDWARLFGPFGTSTPDLPEDSRSVQLLWAPRMIR